MIKKERGITLIALVITIIVLLILAGVTIAALSGENGILIRATEARDKTVKAQKQEEQDLEEMEDFIDESIVDSQWKQNGYEITNGKITVKVGDTVLNYNETTESTEIGTTESGHTDPQTLTTENLGWKILGIGENGRLELISDNATTATVTLVGETGYLNAENVLSRVCDDLYGKGQYAKGARCIKAEDINKLANYNPETSIEYGDLYKFKFDTNANCIQYSKSTDKGVTWSGWENMQNATGTGKPYETFKIPGSTETLSKDNLKTSEEIKNTYYALIQIANEISDTNIANMITKGTGDSNISYWLNTPTTMCMPHFVIFGMPAVRSGNIAAFDMGGAPLYGADGTSYNPSYPIRPVVTLESDVQLEGSSQEGWTLSK